MMVIYDPTYGVFLSPAGHAHGYFDGCFGDRLDPGLSSWVVPGTWPIWCL